MRTHITRMIVLWAVSGCADQRPSSPGFVDEDRAPVPTATLTLSEPALSLIGKIRWLAMVEGESISDSLEFRFDGTDSLGRLNRLAGTVPLAGRGAWDGNKLVFAEKEQILSAIPLGVLRFDVLRIGLSEAEEAVEFIPVELGLEISESGSLISGSIIVHPNTASLSKSGPDPQLERTLSLAGQIAFRTCEVVGSVPAPEPGKAAPLHTIGSSHQLCDQRFGNSSRDGG